MQPRDALVPSLSYSQYSKLELSYFLVYGTEWNNIFPVICVAYCPYTSPCNPFHSQPPYFFSLYVPLLGVAPPIEQSIALTHFVYSPFSSFSYILTTFCSQFTSILYFFVLTVLLLFFSTLLSTVFSVSSFKNSSVISFSSVFCPISTIKTFSSFSYNSVIFFANVSLDLLFIIVTVTAVIAITSTIITTINIICCFLFIFIS